MSFHAILALTRPTDANTKKARIVEEIITAAEAVFTKGMVIPEDKEELEEEQEMWTAQWERRLVRAGALQINSELTGLLSSGVASGKAKGKGKACTLVHVPDVCMSVVQCKVSVRSEVLVFGLMKVNPALSLVHGKVTMTTMLKW